MKKKTIMSPKTALITSVLSLLLCISMFAGTTFAWFTTSISNQANNIMAGSLDIELQYYHVDPISKQGEWKEVTETTKLFDNSAKWEPGYTQVVYLKVENKGSLAFKYQLGVSVNNETVGINQDGLEYKLSDYIMFGVRDTEIAGDTTYDELVEFTKDAAGRTAARASVAETAALIGLGYTSKAAVLDTTENKMDYLTMVIYMPEDVGNEANPEPGKEPKINLSIDLVATQTTNESDAFGTDYDKNAESGVLPAANVKKINSTALPTVETVDGDEVKLDCGYVFNATETYEEAQQSYYALWNADFVVTFDRDVPEASLGLAGQYESYSADWLAFNVPDVDDTDGYKGVKANTPIRLLDFAGIAMTYQELCNFVNTFKCGAFNNVPDNIGLTMTVELRLFEAKRENGTSGSHYEVENGEQVVIGSYSYTFTGNKSVPVADVTEVEPTTVNATLGMGGASESVELDCQFVFKTTEEYEEAQWSEFRFWHADFVVKADQDVAANSIALAGYYAAYCEDYNDDKWVALVNDGADITAGTEIRLLELMLNGGSMSYQELCNWVPEFKCGAADIGGSNAGTTLTVELRLYEVEENTASTDAETGHYITVGTYTHTFN